MDPLTPTLRLAELVGGLTLACDIASGFPPGKVLRTVIIAMRVGRHAGLPEDTLRDTFYTSLLRFLGCTGFSHEEAAEYGAGDDIALRNVMSMADPAEPGATLSSIVRRVGAGAPLGSRVKAVARLIGDGKSLQRHARAQCETSATLAAMVGMSAEVRRSLAATCERWDGRGAPGGLSGEAIEVAMRLHHLADSAEIALHRDGEQAAITLVASRSGRWLDPALCRTFTRERRSILDGLDAPDLFRRFLSEEPEPHAVCDAAGATAVARAFAYLADLKSAFSLGHSTRVASLATRAAREVGLGPAEIEDLERAALLHDVGRLSVPNSIWDRPGKLGFADWERVRLHTYYTERVLVGGAAWRSLAPLAAGAHEQPSGLGYHRALAQSALSRASRILAAADAVAAMREPRAYRPARDDATLKRELAADVRDGKLDAQSVEAVLAAEGLATARPRTAPRGLSEREVEVLRFVARGKTNKEIGALLGISPRTVQVHVAHVYDKLGVYSRAGAAIFAVENALLDEDDKG